MSKQQKRWTEEETARLKELLDRGKTHKEVANILGRGVGSVNARVSLVREKERKERKKEKSSGLAIKDLKDKFHLGEKVKISYSTGIKRDQKAPKNGVIIQKYTHHVVVKFGHNRRESYTYFDLLEVEKIGASCIKGVFLDELDRNRGRLEEEVMEDCSIICQIASMDLVK